MTDIITGLSGFDDLFENILVVILAGIIGYLTVDKYQRQKDCREIRKILLNLLEKHEFDFVTTFDKLFIKKSDSEITYLPLVLNHNSKKISTTLLVYFQADDKLKELLLELGKISAESTSKFLKLLANKDKPSKKWFIDKCLEFQEIFSELTIYVMLTKLK